MVRLCKHTLVHEWSHAVSSTDDNVYGETACHDLATTDPSKAINNADSHEYFAEHLYKPFGKEGIDAALYSGSKCYFFSGNQYIRVTRGDTGPGTVDPGYPAPISNWGWG